MDVLRDLIRERLEKYESGYRRREMLRHLDILDTIWQMATHP